MFLNLLLYLLSFFVLWRGAGLIISSVDKISKRLKLSSFAFSFFILGLLTSIPEFAVGMTAVAEKKPEVFVGNLIGSIPVIFLFIIPLLAVLGNGVKLKNNISSTNLFLAFVVIAAPAFFVLDRRVTNFEGIGMIMMYLGLFLLIQKKNGILDTEHSNILEIKSYSYRDILKVIFGIFLVFISSHFIVENTLYFANLLHISTFYISLIFLALGTNLPELSIAIRSVILKKSEVAFGDYVGSAAANTMLFGVFTLMTTGEVVTVNNFFSPFLILIVGLVMFFIFSRSGHIISKREGVILFLLYVGFVLIEYIPF
ncbi:MAG TPA: hypothetical protein VLF20_01140 [Patescibacteria group bacterium]|nr:hypothetical protein [Patescibacteria group bacterium]